MAYKHQILVRVDEDLFRKISGFSAGKKTNNAEIVRKLLAKEFGEDNRSVTIGDATDARGTGVSVVNVNSASTTHTAPTQKEMELIRETTSEAKEIAIESLIDDARRELELASVIAEELTSRKETFTTIENNSVTSTTVENAPAAAPAIEPAAAPVAEGGAVLEESKTESLGEALKEAGAPEEKNIEATISKEIENVVGIAAEAKVENAPASAQSALSNAVENLVDAAIEIKVEKDAPSAPEAPKNELPVEPKADLDEKVVEKIGEIVQSNTAEIRPTDNRTSNVEKMLDIVEQEQAAIEDVLGMIESAIESTVVEAKKAPEAVPTRLESFAEASPDTTKIVEQMVQETEALKIEAPKAEIPVAQAPIAEMPAAEAPKVEASIAAEMPSAMPSAGNVEFGAPKSESLAIATPAVETVDLSAQAPVIEDQKVKMSLDSAVKYLTDAAANVKGDKADIVQGALNHAVEHIVEVSTNVGAIATNNDTNEATKLQANLSEALQHIVTVSSKVSGTETPAVNNILCEAVGHIVDAVAEVNKAVNKTGDGSAFGFTEDAPPQENASTAQAAPVTVLDVTTTTANSGSEQAAPLEVNVKSPADINTVTSVPSAAAPAQTPENKAN